MAHFRQLPQAQALLAWLEAEEKRAGDEMGAAVEGAAWSAAAAARGYQRACKSIRESFLRVAPMAEQPEEPFTDPATRLSIMGAPR